MTKLSNKEKHERLLFNLAKTNHVHKGALALIEKLVTQKQFLFDENLRLRRQIAVLKEVIVDTKKGKEK